MSEHATTWNEVRKLLREARDQMPPGSSRPEASASPVGLLAGTLEEFEEFLDHNELELAWDALAAVAERASAPSACWRKLARAAALMRLTDKERLATERSAPAVPSDQALAIARKDAEGAYRDLLLDYRITVVLEPDGWHIDYELSEHRMQGGGPHYVIDAQTGAILSKRYEQ
jgi:hypothetical protein